MRPTLIGHHTGELAFLDMSDRSRPPGVHGSVFRIGDRAAAHVWLLHWRKHHPDARILIIDDPFLNQQRYAFTLDSNWVFKDIADEVWMVERPNEKFIMPNGYVLYHANLWRIWRWLHRHCDVVPSIRPPANSIQKVSDLLKKYGVPPCFVTLQPLCDAGYNTHRNAPASWWHQVAEIVSQSFPVVLLGSKQNARAEFATRRIFPLWNEDLSPMDSLALISLARSHIGGETGMTLWSAIFHVPTVAVYANWSESNSKSPVDVRPISFKAPVEFARLSGSPVGVLTALNHASGVIGRPVCLPVKRTILA